MKIHILNYQKKSKEILDFVKRVLTTPLLNALSSVLCDDNNFISPPNTFTMKQGTEKEVHEAEMFPHHPWLEEREKEMIQFKMLFITMAR